MMIEMRFLKKNNNKIYIRKEDVYNYLMEMASTEESDVRNRLEEAATNLDKLGELPVCHCGKLMCDHDQFDNHMPVEWK